MRWVLLRGLLREQRHWGHFPQQLAEALSLSGGDLVPLDLPGMGTEASRRFPMSLEKVVDDLRERLGLRIGEKVVIFSMSLGSMCALQWAQSYPDEIAGLVVINTSASDLSSLKERLTLSAMKAFSRVMRVSDAEEREDIILKLTSNLRAYDPALARKWASFAPTKKQLLKVGLRQLLIAARFRAPSKIEVPALILSSVADRLASPESSARLAKRYGVENHVHLEAGHDIVLDDPEWIIRKTVEWKDRFLRSQQA